MRARLIIFFVHTLALMPLPVSRWFGSVLGSLGCMMRSRGYLVSVRNLEIAYPNMPAKERKKMAVESMKHSAQMVTETGAVWFRGHSWREKKMLKMVNRQAFDSARDSDQGLMILMPHFGNWEMAGQMAAAGTATTAVYAPPKIQALDPLFRSGRAAAEMVPASMKGVTKVLKALKRGEMTLILPDQVPAEEGGIYAPFYGKPCLTMTLIHKLIQKTKPVVLITYAIRRQGGFEVGYMEPDVDIYSHDEQASVTALNHSIEMLIEKAPTQYQWEYKRYKTQPDRSNPYEGC